MAERNKDWSDYFIEAFNKSYNNGLRMNAYRKAQEYDPMEDTGDEEENTWKNVLGLGLSTLGGADSVNAYQRAQLQQRSQLAGNRQKQVLLDVNMYKKGFDRVETPEEMKEIMQQQNVLGYPAAGGAVGIPVGGSFKDGSIYDKQGNQVGEYSPGYEPGKVKNIVGQVGNKVIKVGNLMYQARDEKIAQNIPQTVEELNNQYSQGGSWIPGTTTPGGKTSYRFAPTSKARGVDGVTNALLTGQPIQQTPNTPPPPKNITPELKSARDMVTNAIKQGASLEELMQGITDEGLNPNDFADMIYPLYMKRQQGTQKTMTTQQVIPPPQYRRIQ